MSNVGIFRNLKYHWTLSWFAYVSEGFASKVIVLLCKSSMLIYDIKINKFYSYMLRGSSRSVRRNDIARNIKIMVLRKLAEAIFKRKHSRKLRLWSRKLCGSPRGTWGLRQAVLKGINDTAHMVILKNLPFKHAFSLGWCHISWAHGRSEPLEVKKSKAMHGKLSKSPGLSRKPADAPGMVISIGRV